MTRRVTFTVKNDETLAFLDRKVEEMNLEQDENTPKLTRTDYLNYMLEREMEQNSSIYQRTIHKIETKLDQTRITTNGLKKVIQEQNKLIKNLIEEIEL